MINVLRWLFLRKIRGSWVCVVVKALCKLMVIFFELLHELGHFHRIPYTMRLRS